MITNLITETHFLSIVNKNHEETGLGNEDCARESFDLAKNLAISFAIWISDFHVARRGGLWVSTCLEIYTTEQLFELYLKSQG